MKTINLKLTESLHKELRRQSVEEDTSMNALLVRIATEYLQSVLDKKHDRPKTPKEGK